MTDIPTPLAKQPLLEMLPPELRPLLADSFEPVSVGFGEVILREGDEADAFYVLVSGRARVLKQAEDGSEIPLNVVRPGDGFGETALLEDTRRTATVRASGDVELLRLDRGVFRALVQNHPEIRDYLELRQRHLALHTFLRAQSAFARLPAPALRTLLENLEPLEVGKGECVVNQGEKGDALYVIEEGRLRAYLEHDGERKYLSYLRTGDFFGEVALFKGVDRTASVEAVSPAKLLRLGETTFKKLVADYPEFRKRIEEQIGQYDYQRTARVPLDFADEVMPAEMSAAPAVSPDQVTPAGEAVDEEDPFASKEGYFRKRKKRVRRFRHIRQVDAMDCGAACVAMICRHFGRNVSLARIRQLLHVSNDGTSLSAICHGAEALGLAARSVKVSRSNLLQMPLPAVVHWGGNHWVILYHVDEKHAFVADPATTLRKVPLTEFEKEWSGYAALFDYTQDFDEAPESNPGLSWVWPFVRPHMDVLGRSFGLALVVGGLQMVFPVFSQVVVDRVVVEQDISLLRTIIVAMVGVLGAMMLSLYLQRYLMSWAAVRIDSSTLDFITRKMLALPMSYFNTRRTGDIQRRLEGARELREFLVNSGVVIISSVTTFIAALTLMFVYSPLLAGVFLATAPLYVLLMRFSQSRLRPLYADLEEAYGRYQSHQIDAIKGIETVKAMGGESGFRNLMLAQFHGISQRVFRSDLTVMSYEAMVQSVTFLSMVLFLAVGALQVMNGNLTIGGLVAFNALVAMANQPIVIALSLWDDYQLSTVMMDRLNDIFETEPEQGHDHSQLRAVPSLEGRVTLRDVGFRYGGPESPPILDGIEIDVPAGKHVAIVGRSGSGKTTLVKLLAGLIEPTDGTILFDGIDMKTLRYRDLRRQIGFVLQENHLFDDTIAANIAFGEEEPDMDRVIWAARVASANEFIEQFPLGYETQVGESGIQISGGQRQRISIARSVYHRPPIMIMDEATSALDTESEKAVKENMDRLLENCTSFVIAHRMSTIRNADLILVLEKGMLAERGSHEELMERKGLYYYLCSQQLGL